MKMNSKVYDVLKYITTIGLPALATLYFTIASMWNLPYAEQIVGTIAAITTFLGTLLGISSHNYKKININGIQDVNDNEFVEGIPEDDNKPTI